MAPLEHASCICLGTAPFGADLSEESSFAVLDAYVGGGGNFLDTAHIYGAWVAGCWGASERVIGRWLHARGARDRMILATKGGCPPLDRLTEPGRLSPEALGQDLEESLERLGVDYVDVYWLHRDDERVPVGRILDTVMVMIGRGRIRGYGLSNWSAVRLRDALAHADAHGLPRPVGSQIGYACATYPRTEPPLPGMVYAGAEDEAFHRETTLPLFAYTAQAGGWFGDANVTWAAGGFAGPPPHGGLFDSPENRRRLFACMAIAEARSVTANRVALAWLLHRPFPVTAIVGTSRPERVRDAMDAAALRLKEEELERIGPELP